MSCKLQTENISNILCNYLCASHNQLFLRRFHQFSVQSKCVHLLQWSQSTQSTFLPFLPFVGGSSFPQTPVTCITLFFWFRVPFSGRLSFSHVDYNNFIICLTYIKLYYFVDAISWRQNAVTPFNWFISSYFLNWLANISFVWTTDDWFHRTTTYFFLSFIKTMLANWKNVFILL